MNGFRRKYAAKWVLCVFLLSVALLFRGLNDNKTLSVGTVFGVIQTVIYTGLVAFWGFSVHRRIVQPQIRRMLVGTHFFLLFWFLLRAVKYYVLPYFENTENVHRYLWYMYYLPMLVLSALVLMIAFSLRKPESYRFPKKAIAMLFSVAAVLFICVITNDLHRLVFIFPDNGEVFSDAEYSYGFLYYIYLVWNVGCLFVAFAVTIKKCRLPGGKKILWLPIVPIVLWIVYGIMYITNNVFYVDDITVVYGFLLITAFELFIAVGLIPSNLHYVELFRASDISVAVTDRLFNTVYSTDKAVQQEKEALQNAVENSSVTENGMRLSAYSINGGYAFYEEDVTELYEAIEELADVRSELKEEYYVAQEMLATSRKRQALVEKNRLYNIMQSETQAKTQMLCDLLKKLSATDNKAERKAIATRVAVYLAYLKRRNNLLFLKENSDTVRSDELVFCIRESLDNFSLLGAETNFNADLELDMSFRNITRMYDAFETALEVAQEETSELFVVLKQVADEVVLYMNFVCRADLSCLARAGFSVSDEGDGEWAVRYAVREGGEPG